MKGYNTFPKDPVLEPHDQIQLSIINRGVVSVF